ncbi:MAG: hypothetical protein GXO74_12330 [Calditrichaeota bacterium]|nr:hypothetical protein [Calditrichota bacterium]
MKSYQIIATLGPATENRISDLIAGGATGFRLNCAHLSWEKLSRYLLRLEEIFQRIGDSMPVWLDLQGTKLRLGVLQKPQKIDAGQKIKFVPDYNEKNDAIPFPHLPMFREIKPGDAMVIDDGKIELEVEKSNYQEIAAIVRRGGVLQSFKGVTFVNKMPSFQEVTGRDRTIIEQTSSLKFLGYAISYLQNAEELQLFRDVAGGKPLTAKIEREEALRNLVEISAIANVTWLCRGDLGANTNVFDLYHYERHFAKIMAMSGKPYLIAGQALEHFTHNPSATRAEIAHLGFLVDLGFSGVVLSDETAIGDFPVEAVKFCRDLFEYLPDQ